MSYLVRIMNVRYRILVSAQNIHTFISHRLAAVHDQIGGRGGLAVGELDCQSEGPGSIPGRGATQLTQL